MDKIRINISAGYEETAGIDAPYSEMMNDPSTAPTSGTKDRLEQEATKGLLKLLGAD